MWITAILVLLWQTVAAHAGPIEDCFEQVQNIDVRIDGCTDRIRQFPRDATAFFNRGAAYLSKGEYDLAIADYTAVIQIDPAYSPAYYYRGIANESRELDDQAIADFSKAVELNPRNGRAFAARARVYLKTGRYAPALRDAERAVSLDPYDEASREARAHAYEALGHIREAVADYRRLLSGNPSMKSALDGLRRLGASPSAPKPAADDPGKAKVITKPSNYTAQPRYSREETECELAEYQDPVRQYWGYPCWARDALGRSRVRGR